MIGKAQTIVIGRQFRGPPQSGNGGYVSGLLAKVVKGPAAVTLRAPVPLDRPLQLTQSADSECYLLDDAAETRRIAEIRPDTLALQPPQPPAWETVLAMTKTGGSAAENAFGGCFVCGRSRVKGDGLRVFASSRAHTDKGRISLAAFVPEPVFADSNGIIGSEYHWAALDCPGAAAVYNGAIMLTGRMTGAVYRPLRAHEKATVVGWPMGENGRKIYTGTAIFGENGDICAAAYALWILLKEGHPNFQPTL